MTTHRRAQALRELVSRGETPGERAAAAQALAVTQTERSEIAERMSEDIRREVNRLRDCVELWSQAESCKLESLAELTVAALMLLVPLVASTVTSVAGWGWVLAGVLVLGFGAVGVWNLRKALRLAADAAAIEAKIIRGE